MEFSNPLALILLFSFPVLIYLGLPLRVAAGRREILALGIRLILMTSLIFALAGLELTQRSNQLAVIFLLDGSDSIPTQVRADAETMIQASLAEMGPEDRAGLIVFGRESVVERPLSSSRELGVIHSSPGRDQTDLEEAIRLALALLPPDAARRIVILSDGVQTSGDASAAARLAAAAGVQIVAVPLTNLHGAEVLVADVSAPARIREGENFNLQVTFDASQPGDSQIRVFANGQLVFQGSQWIERGRQSFSLPLQADQALAESGRFIRYQVQIDPINDSYYQNNQASAYSQVEGPPRLLVIAPPPGEPLPFRSDDGPTIRPDEAAYLLQVLTEAGYQLKATRPSGLPEDLIELANYEAIILVDVPARDLSLRQMEAVQSFVRDLGGGLLAIGGPTSFGVGGYYRTPLEETLPVEMQIKDQLRRPNLTMLFVIDHSGSMGEASGGVSKLELAKEAAIRSIELLNPTDRVGVIAFDDSAAWVVPITGLDNLPGVVSRIGALRDGGGTDILAGLQAMAEALPADPASVKHVILLTDGGADPAGIPELVTRMNEEYSITLTTVGVGSDAAPYLANLAELGGGRYHFAADPGAIPRIFTEETSLAARSYIIERTFTPIRASNSAILTGLDSLPPLRGYIGATTRSVAQSILVSDLSDPILATWQYGLGRAAAFTSDASGRWASEWVSWQGFPTFWAQTIQSVLPGPEQSMLDLRVEPAGENASLIVDARSETGDFLNGYLMQANIAYPNGTIMELELEQIAPGEYQGTFTPQVEGAYLIGITGLAQDQAVSEGSQPVGPELVAETAGWVHSYASEYRQLNQQDSLELASLTDLTGGWIAEGPLTNRIFAHDLQAGKAAIPTWPWLLALAAMLLPFDIAVRRLALTPRELKQAFLSTVKRLLPQPAEVQSKPAQDQTTSLAAFMRAKRRTGQKASSQVEQPDFERDIPSIPGQKGIWKPPSHPDSEPAGGEQGSEPYHGSGDPSGRKDSTAASLLAAKRKRKRQQ